MSRSARFLSDNVIILVIIISIVFPVGQLNDTKSLTADLQILYPKPDSRYNHPDTSIAIWFNETIDKQSIQNHQFFVTGSESGLHFGKSCLAVDQKSLIYMPDQPFIPGENVKFELQPGIKSKTGFSYSGLSFSFSISKTTLSSSVETQILNSIINTEISSGNIPTASFKPATSQFVTLPSDFPKLNVTTNIAGTDNGYIFASNFDPAGFLGGSNPGSYLLILDNNGDPVYYQKVPENAIATDFKKLSNGLLAYWESGEYHLLDTNYDEVKLITAQNGYPSIDVHELLLFNDHYMYLIYQTEQIDMSKIVPGGDPNAYVIGTVIQEVDSQDNVVFEWNSFNFTDTLPITYTNQNLSTAQIDYMHSNAISIDSDNNILLSIRHMDKIIKINHETGDIIWQLGGQGNQFTIETATEITDTPEFYMQHDIRKLPNGDITIFDNHNDHEPMISKAMEFSLDEENKIVTLVWDYRNTPDVYSAFMGNVQLLPNGNFFIGWGGVSSPNATEIQPDGTKLFELGFDTPYVNYRSYRFPWNGYPTWPPTLVVTNSVGGLNLSFSWNGATDISKYDIYGINPGHAMELIDEVTKTGFETGDNLVGIQAGYCYYRVMPIDLDGEPTQISNIVKNPSCFIQFMPFIMKYGH
jgi:hypothetical protein